MSFRRNVSLLAALSAALLLGVSALAQPAGPPSPHEMMQKFERDWGDAAPSRQADEQVRRIIPVVVSKDGSSGRIQILIPLKTAWVLDIRFIDKAGKEVGDPILGIAPPLEREVPDNQFYSVDGTVSGKPGYRLRVRVLLPGTTERSTKAIELPVRFLKNLKDLPVQLVPRTPLPIPLPEAGTIST